MTLVYTIQKIIRAEINKLKFSELGIITSIFPHSEDSDKDNYEVNVMLKGSGLELRKVPVATDHIGNVNIPDVGDLVMIAFINGKIDQPVITGRLYDQDKRPPVNLEKEYLIEAPYGSNTRIQIDKDLNLVLKTGTTIITLKNDSNIEISSADKLELSVEGDTNLSIKGQVSLDVEGDISITSNKNVNIDCKNAAIKATGNIDLGESGGAVITNMTHKCFLTGAPPVGSATVKAKA